MKKRIYHFFDMMQWKEKEKYFPLGKKILTFALTLFLLSFLYDEYQIITMRHFGDERRATVEAYVAVTLGHGDEEKTKIKVCKEYKLFMSYLPMNTRYMADDELAKAVSLYDACAPSVTIEREYLTTLFAKQAQNLERLSPFLLQKEVSVSAKNIAKSWSETASLLALKNQILAKSLLIQKEFWQTEIKSNNGEITFNDRQEIFTRLNDSSRALDDKIRDIDAKIQVLQASEADYWQTYKVSARYSEQE